MACSKDNYFPLFADSLQKRDSVRTYIETGIVFITFQLNVNVDVSFLDLFLKAVNESLVQVDKKSLFMFRFFWQLDYFFLLFPEMAHPH